VAPVVALQAERPYLLAVRRSPYRLELVVCRKVDRYCLVRLDGAANRWSPATSAPRSVWSSGPVTVGGDRRGGRVIGQYLRAGTGQVSFDPARGAAVEALTLASLGVRAAISWSACWPAPCFPSATVLRRASNWPPT
jgi:hypothetical protein